MKKIITLFLLVQFTAIIALAQTTVATGLNKPIGLALNGNQLFISEYGNNGDPDKISKVDLTQALPAMATTALDGIIKPTGLIVIGDYLYFNTEFDIPAANETKTGRINLTSATPAIEQVLTSNIGLNHEGFVLGGNFLYISSAGNITGYESGIYKIDITAPLPQAPIPVKTGINVSGMALRGNDLYYGYFDGNEVFKINTTQSNPTPQSVISGLQGPDGLTFSGDFLYISQSSGSEIIKIDVTQTPAVSEVVASGLAGPTLVVFDGLDLYFAEQNGGKVSKVSVNQLSFPNLPTACSSDAAVQGGGGSPSGGIYSGTNVTDDGNGETFTFNATAAGTGMHNVAYSFAGSPLTANASIQVVPADDASFSFASANYDVDGADPTPTVTGLAGGTFTSMPAGLSIDATTGMLDLSASMPNTYIITYTTAGTCPNSSTFGLTINDVVIPTPDNECSDANDISPLFGQPLNMPQTSGTWDNTSYTSLSSDPTTGFECFGEPDGSGSDPSLERTIWYAFEGDGSTYKITTVPCNATNYIGDGDTQMAVYSGDCTNLTAVACNEDETGAADFRATVELETQAGLNYLLMVDGFGPNFEQMGEFCLEVTNLAPNAVTNIEQTDIEIFPNPTTGEIQITNIEADQVQVFDNMGRLVFSKKQPGSGIDISNVPAGFYFMKIHADGEVYSARVVKE